MDRRVEKYFPLVLRKVEEVFREEINGKGIPSAYKGYISTFGSMVIQNGILPALAYYEKEDSNEKIQNGRKKIIKVIKEFLKDQNEIGKDANGLLVETVIKKVSKKGSVDKDELRRLEGKIIDISIALKLSLRTFLEVKEGN